jgi:thioredoxin reductase
VTIAKMKFSAGSRSIRTESIDSGLFTQPYTHLASPVSSKLGCALAEGPTGPFIEVDPMRQASVPNAFACGDSARTAGNVAMPVAYGLMARHFRAPLNDELSVP